jgi:hypothetical protein
VLYTRSEWSMQRSSDPLAIWQDEQESAIHQGDHRRQQAEWTRLYAADKARVVNRRHRTGTTQRDVRHTPVKVCWRSSNLAIDDHANARSVITELRG